MSDLICRPSMMRCQTPGMCAPYGGCHVMPSAASILGVKCTQCSKHYSQDSYNAGFMLANKGVCHDCLVGHTEMMWCGCGDGYPKGSFDAGYMDASGGICQNCSAAKPQTTDKVPELPFKPVVDWRVWAVGDTVRYLGSGGDEDRWCHARMTIDSDYLVHEAPDEHESMVVLDDDGDEIGVLVGEFEFVKAGAEPEGLAYVDGKAGDLSVLFSMLKGHAATFGSTDTAMGAVAAQIPSEEDKALYAQWVKQAADNPVDDSGALCGG